MILQAIVFALVLTAVTAWLAVLIRRRETRVAVVAGAVVASAAAAVGAIALREPWVPESKVPRRPIEVPDDGYVKSEACRSCHPSQHQAWDDSYHSSMTQVATPQAVVGDFGNVYLELYGDPYILMREGDRYFVDMVDPIWRLEHGIQTAATPPRVKREVVLTTGSHHMQLYWYSAGADRTLGLLPFVWQIKEQMWIPRVSAFVLPPTLGKLTGHEEIGRWNDSCITCHATVGKPRIERPAGAPPSTVKNEQLIPGSTTDTHVTELGIACEACHGPGREHIEANWNPLRRWTLRWKDEPDPTIVNPARLDGAASAQVCGQCHGTQQMEDWSSWARDGFTYKPGDDLFASRTVLCSDTFDDPAVETYLERYPMVFTGTFWPDGVVRVAGREFAGVSVSPCYKNGSGERKMTCLSCHVMHQPEDDPRPRAEWANDQLKIGMDGNQACLQCHEKYAPEAALVEHTRHLATSPGSNCLDCHMPYQNYALLSAIRSHTILSPNVTQSIEGGRPNACNQCHLDKSYGWTADYLSQWYGIETPQLTDVERAVPASLLWLFQGDAAQRALVAWNMGWSEAHRASGNQWIGAFLPQLLMDPYDAIRLIAYRSMKKLPGFETFECNTMAPVPELEASATRAMRLYQAQRQARGEPGLVPDIVHDPTGTLPPATVLLGQLLQQRNNQPTYLFE